MPPKKRPQQRSLKAKLLFHQQPLEGPKHPCVLPQHPITHTLQVPSKTIDHSTITSWVTPQFDTTAENRLLAPQKHHHRDRPKHSSRKSTRKFPHLAFERPQSSSSNQSEKNISRRRPLVPVLSPQSCGDLSVHALQSLPYVCTPPDIQTPESSVKDNTIPPDQRENSLPRCILHTGTTKSPEPGPVLVKDTPEDKYGIKVTWRRRRHLFAHLKEKGKLSRSQFLAKS
uniref:RAD9, HUS1, RAD1-interacting nuclear orphan protein 1 n=1 Tax=Castor canadensis TaxID=51338 RepID=A0A250XWJ9_CASCN|nr:RAD9, HUS1, RAD1-interacting nuclear orphan protein 1 [Castor canadensis]